jgi:hypothetical protein
MRTATCIVFALMVVVVTSVGAQTPIVGVYFDQTYQTQAEPGFDATHVPCPGFGLIDTVYIAASNFNAFVTAFEFQVEYPPAIGWMADIDFPGMPNGPGGITLGDTPSGISAAFGIFQDGYSTIEIGKVQIQWLCEFCVEPYLDNPIVVTGHPAFHPLNPRALRFPDEGLIDGVGLTSLICATVPTEDTTWGKVKALYNE